jgi:hypothetical protein
MDEQRLFEDMGELKAGVFNAVKGIDVLREDIKTLRTEQADIKETRVSLSTFRWVVGALSTTMLTLFGIAIKLGLRP